MSRRRNKDSGNTDDQTGTPGTRPRKQGPEFGPSDWEYTLDEFIVPAQDGHGHSVREWVRLSPSLERDIEIIVSRKAFPYQTKSDLLRHAVYRHLHFLHRLEPTMPKHYLAAVDAINEVLREDEFRTKTEEVFSRLQTRIDQHTSRGDTGESMRLIAVCRQKLAEVPDCSWKRRWVVAFNQRFRLAGSIHSGSSGGTRGPVTVDIPRALPAPVEPGGEEDYSHGDAQFPREPEPDDDNEY